MAAGATNVGSRPSHADYAILSTTEADKSGTRRTDCGVRSGLWAFSGLFEGLGTFDGKSGAAGPKGAQNGLRFDGSVRTVFRIQFLHYTTHMDFDGALAHTEFIGYDFI